MERKMSVWRDIVGGAGVRRGVAVVVAGLCAACGKPASQVSKDKAAAGADNQVTRYVENLQADVQKARRAADQLEKRAAEQRETMNKAYE